MVTKGHSMATEISINTAVRQKLACLQFYENSCDVKLKLPFPMVKSLALAYYDHITLF